MKISRMIEPAIWLLEKFISGYEDGNTAAYSSFDRTLYVILGRSLSAFVNFEHL